MTDESDVERAATLAEVEMIYPGWPVARYQEWIDAGLIVRRGELLILRNRVRLMQLQKAARGG